MSDRVDVKISATLSMTILHFESRLERSPVVSVHFVARAYDVAISLY